MIIVAVAALVFVLVRRRGGSSRVHRDGFTGLELPADRTAAELRAEADAFAAAKDWSNAVRARLRGVVRALEERGVIDPRPGRTAAEVAAEAGSLRPELRDSLWKGALTFGEIWYGGRPGTAADDAILRELESAVRRRGSTAGVGAGPLPVPPPS